MTNSAAARALAAGRTAFGLHWQPARRAIAPGRLELLGNHLDYNGGPVLAAAINRTVTVVADDAANRPGMISAVAADVPGTPSVDLALADLRDWRNPSPPPEPFDYLRGSIASLLAKPDQAPRSALRLAIAGDVPIGFGLSSSAALCVALTLILAEKRPVANDLVLLAQEAEHRAGTPCGTMDQSASVAGNVILFDGATHSWQPLQPQLGDLVFAVVDSGVQRSLGASSYAQRVAESHQILQLASAKLPTPLPHLAALTANQLATLERLPESAFPARLRRRARHVVSETARVEDGAVALRAGDWQRFGELMTASGHSSAVDYEISHPRVEELVAETLRVDGVLGARMMGGGEGGVALVLLPRATVPALTAALRAGYLARYGLADRNDALQICTFGPGARVEPVTDP